MKKLRFIVLVLSCLFIAPVIFAEGSFSSIQERLKNNEKSFSQFQYLGGLHCVGYQMHSEENRYEWFNDEYTKLYKLKETFPQTIKQESLDSILTSFETELVPANIPYKFRNNVELCRALYRSPTAKELYYRIISDKNNYHEIEDEGQMPK